MPVVETINQSDCSAQIQYRALRGTEGCGGKQRVHRKGWGTQRGAEVGTKLECHEYVMVFQRGITSVQREDRAWEHAGA